MPDDRVYVPSDPQGLYGILGVGPLADAEEIRDAFRRRVKLVHPDFNPAIDAPQRFQSVTNAYRILRDPYMRSRYDAGGAVLAPLSVVDPESSDSEPLECSRCGKVTAQPRYMIFHRVKSALWRARRSTVRGIFCRDCADRTVISASTKTWLQGWWAVDGPWRTVQALWINLTGGERPRAENFGVLLHQAHAFLALGDADIAWALADQAGRFAASPRDHERVAHVHEEAGRPTRRMRSRWPRVSIALLAQALPLVALAFAIGAVVAVPILDPRTDQGGAGITVHAGQSGDVRHVAIELLKMRQGPSAESPVLEILDRFTTVKVLGAAENGEWTVVAIPSGVTGYVPSRYLFAGAGDAPRRHWCESNRGDPPRSGDVLLRRAGGDHRAEVMNDTGQDAVVRLKTMGGQTLLALYVGAGNAAAVAGIPDGTFRITYATGARYSRACGVFLDSMASYALDAPQIFVSGSRAKEGLVLRLPAPSDESVVTQPLTAEQFVD